MRTLLCGFFMVLVTQHAFAYEGRSIPYKIGEKTYEGYYIVTGKWAPFVLLIHDWDGLTDYEITRARMLAKLGYTVFAADLFGKGIRPEKIEDKKRLTDELYKDRTKMRALMHGALVEAGRLGARVDNGVAVGYCFGGAAVLELARSGEPLKGFVVFHGGLETPPDQDYSGVRGKVLILHGAADKVVTMDQFADLAKKLESAKIVHEMIAYGGAGHAFSVFGGERYNEHADKKSWKRFIAFLEETLKEE